MGRLIERVRDFMARPKIVRTPAGGEITLKNVEEDIAERIKELVTGKVKGIVAEAIAEVEDSAELYDEVEYKDLAVGTATTDGVYAVVVVGFDLKSHTARILEVDKLASLDKPSAISAFKITASKKGLVG